MAKLEGHLDAVLCVALSLDGNTIVSGGGNTYTGGGDASIRQV